MKAVFGLGWLLLVGGFLAAAAETTARLSTKASSVIVSASELWNSLSPATFSATRNAVEDLSPALWDPVLTSILFLPGWLVLGGPGAVIAWMSRPGRHDTGPSDDDISPMSLYDDLAKFAKEEGYDKEVDDMAPSFGNLDWGHDEKALRRGRGVKHEDIGEESARFTDELAKRAAAEGYATGQTGPELPPKSKPKTKGKAKR